MAFGLNTEEQWEDYQKYINEFNLNDEDSSYWDQDRDKSIRKDIKQTFLIDVPIQYPYGQIQLPLPRFFLVQDSFSLPYIEFYKYVKNSNEYNIRMLLNDVEDENLNFKISSKPFFNKNIVLEFDRESKSRMYFRAQRNTYDIKNVDIVFTEVFENFYTHDQDNEEYMDLYRDLYSDITNIKFSDLEVIQDNKQKRIMIDRIFNEYYNNDNPVMVFFIKKFFEITGFSYIDETIEFYLPILWRIYIISRYQKNMQKEDVIEIINSYFKQILSTELNLTFQDITNKEEPFNIETFMVLRKDKLDSFEKQFDPFFFKIKFLVSEYNYGQYLKYFEDENNYVKWNKFFLQDLFLRGKISLDALQNYIEGVQDQLNESFQDIEFFTNEENNTQYYKLLLQSLYEDKIPVLEYLITSENKKTNYPICMNETDIKYYEVYDSDWFIEEFRKDLQGEQEEYRLIHGDIGKLTKEIEQTFLLQIPIMRQYEGKVVIPLRVPSSVQFESPFRIRRSKYLEIVTQTQTTFIELLQNNKIRDINNKQIIGEFNEELNLLVIDINKTTFEFKNIQKIFFDIEFDIEIEYTNSEIRSNYLDYLTEDNEFIYFELPLNRQFRLKRKMPGISTDSNQGIPQQTYYLQEQGISGFQSYSLSADDLQTTILEGSITIYIDGQQIQTDDRLGQLVGEYLGDPISGEVDYEEGTIVFSTTQPIQSDSNVTLNYSISWESTNIFNVERDDKINIEIGSYKIYQDQTNNLFYDRSEYNEELEEMIKRPINVGKYLEKERTIVIKKYFDNQVTRDYEDETLVQDVSIDDNINVTLDVIYVKDYLYYIFCTLFQEYNYWYNTHNYRDKTSQFIYNRYKVSNLREMDYFQLQHIHKEILYKMLFDVYFVNENHYNKQGCVFNQIYPSTLNKLNQHLFEMNNFLDIIPTFDMFYFDFKKLFKNLSIYTPEKFIKYNETTHENENISTEEKRRLIISLSKDNLLLKLNDSLNTDNSLNPFFDQNRYILSSQDKFNSNKLNNFILYNYSQNTIEEIEKNTNFLSYFPQFQLDFKYDYQFQDLKEMNVSVDNLQMEVLDTIKLIKLGSLEGLIKQGTSYFNFKW